MIKSTQFKGVTVEYDDAKLKSWSFMKRLATAQGQFGAMDELFNGKADEIASQLNDSFEAMMELMGHLATIEGNTAKN